MKSEIMKADLMSETTKADSYNLPSSVDSRRGYIRPRTNSPFPPLKVKAAANNLIFLKESESLNSSINKRIIDIWSETKLSPEWSMFADYKVLNYDDATWVQFLKDKQRGEHRGLNNNSHFRLSSAQQSNPFLDSSIKRFWSSIDKQRSAYRVGEMSAPGSANSTNFDLNNPRRNRTNLNQNCKIQYIGKQEESIPVKIELDQKTIIDWKAVALNSNDLDIKDRELLGFSPPYLEQNRELHKRDSSLIILKSKILIPSQCIY